MKLSAYAKVNLFLEVLSGREDGYHDIVTIFQQIDLADEIYLTPLDQGIKIVCDHPAIPQDEKNLVWPAANLIRSISHRATGMEIKIVKKIPVAAGLGGGSSDAAAVLMGLNQIWNLGLSREKLADLGLKIGSDVPFFIYGGRALGEGRGEKLAPLANQKFWLILVNPCFPVATKEVYALWDRDGLELTKRKNLNRIRKSVFWQGPIEQISAGFFNSLERIVLSLYPELKRIKTAMLDLGIKNVTLSGSGPTLFGWVENKTSGEKILRQLSACAWPCWLVSTK